MKISKHLIMLFSRCFHREFKFMNKNHKRKDLKMKKYLRNSFLMFIKIIGDSSKSGITHISASDKRKIHLLLSFYLVENLPNNSDTQHQNH